jgi:MYXO-CTERM domain-containing protein
MSRPLFFAFAVLFAFTASQARAGLILTYEGQTYQNSSLAGNPIPNGTDFRVDVAFPDTYSTLYQGVTEFSVDSIQVEVGGTPYAPIFGPTDYGVALADTAHWGFFAAVFGPSGFSSGFSPAYQTATTAGWSELAPTPTQFDGYFGTWFAPSLSFDTAAGALVLDFNRNQIGSVTTQITGDAAVPEPSALLFGLTGFGAIVLARRRRS